MILKPKWYSLELPSRIRIAGPITATRMIVLAAINGFTELTRVVPEKDFY